MFLTVHADLKYMRSVAANDTQIAILSRSILEILVDLSSSIVGPEAHVADRRMTPRAEPAMKEGVPLLTIPTQ